MMVMITSLSLRQFNGNSGKQITNSVLCFFRDMFLINFTFTQLKFSAGASEIRIYSARVSL